MSDLSNSGKLGAPTTQVQVAHARTPEEQLAKEIYDRVGIIARGLRTSSDDEAVQVSRRASTDILEPLYAVYHGGTHRKAEGVMPALNTLHAHLRHAGNLNAGTLDELIKNLLESPLLDVLVERARLAPPEPSTTPTDPRRTAARVLHDYIQGLNEFMRRTKNEEFVAQANRTQTSILEPLLKASEGHPHFACASVAPNIMALHEFLREKTKPGNAESLKEQVEIARNAGVFALLKEHGNTSILGQAFDGTTKPGATPPR